MSVALSFMVGIVLFAAVEFFYPERKGDELSHRHKRFWATVMFVLGFVAGLLFEEFSRLEDHISDISSVFRAATDPEIDEEFRSLYDTLSAEMLHGDVRIRRWAIDNLRTNTASLRAGFVTIPRDSVAREIGNLYPEARDHVVATNVGSVDFFFVGPSGQQYIDNNKSLAVDRHVPVVRYYLTHLKGVEGKAREQCFETIKRIHLECHTLHSVVLDLDSIRSELARDVILFDGAIAAESTLSPGTNEYLGARVTSRPMQIDEIRNYLYALTLETPLCEYYAEDKIVHDDFPQYLGLISKTINPGQSDGLAREVLRRVLREVEPHRQSR